MAAPHSRPAASQGLNVNIIHLKKKGQLCKSNAQRGCFFLFLTAGYQQGAGFLTYPAASH